MGSKSIKFKRNKLKLTHLKIPKNIFVKPNKYSNKNHSILQNTSPKCASIKTKFILAFVSFALIPFILVSIIYTMVSKSALKTTSNTLNLEIVRQVTNNLNTTINTVEEDIVNLGANTILSSGYLTQAVSSDEKERKSAMLRINSLISTSKIAPNSITETCIIFSDQNFVIGSIRDITSNILIDYVTQNTSPEFQWALSEKFKAGDILITKQFKDLGRNITYHIASRFRISTFTDYINSVTLLKDATIYLLDNNASLVYSTDSNITELPAFINPESLASTELTSFNSDDNVIAYNTLTNGWKLIVQTPDSSLTEKLDATLTFIFLLLLAIVILAIFFGYFYANTFAKPIIHLMTLMGQAEKGDLTVHAPVQGNDEISALCTSFNNMIDNIKTLITNTQKVIGHTISSSETLNQSASQSVSNMEELAIAVSEIAQGTTIQALDAQKSTQGMQGLAKQMDTVGGKASTLLANTEGAKSMIESASSVIQSLTNTMTSSVHMTNDICDSITELNTLTQNIEDIMVLVDNISGQTNLLALNASIEAARVGEAGKGFSVVANEVRNLADQSKESTKDVRSTLGTIEEKMKITVQLAQNSKQILSDQENVVHETYTLFHKIIDILTSMLNELQDINESVNDMRSLKEVMLNQIGSIANVTEESAASTEEVSGLATEQQNIMGHFSTLSNELSRNMNELNEIIRAFKVTQ
ncbi:MAG: methyl-accepting chemotaxis protein [Cellulosilyticum sp.]|nr:methyl-accepting chemotaxis protein [Cellulosilyticum sp.]